MQHGPLRSVPWIRGVVRKVAHCYAERSNKRPFLVAAITGGVVCGASDTFAQYVTRPEQEFTWDKRRTLSLVAFGTIWYGGPCKALYLGYERFIGASTALRAGITTLIDVGLHTPFALLPSFYLITGLLQGNSMEQISAKMQREWRFASCGMACFWIPVCALNFFFVPQHSRILAVTSAGFVNKTWLSWHSNCALRI
eukprot:TRINITY_DN91592_c0_g1_i1.p1 TRINITY_DN91592_c0_g1~~TRINITY_DN91592_c0_g1_i1.p1  ORF type:complete len:197 (+),score=16.14 TRINITY_DN91592_c0_g1_i1:134-724(+)